MGLVICVLLIGCESTNETNIDSIKLKELQNEITALKEENNNLINEVTRITNEKERIFNDFKAIEKQKKELEDKLSIPEHPYTENLVLTKNFIKIEDLTIDSIIKILGEPNSVNEYINVHSGGTEFNIKYNNAEFIFIKNDNKTEIKSYKIYDSTFSTQRGITVGSSKEEVEDAYGIFYMKITEPKEKWYSADKQGIWFEFEEDYVSGFGVWFYYE